MVRISRFGCCSLILIAAACGKVSEVPTDSGPGPGPDGPTYSTFPLVVTVAGEGTVTGPAGEEGDAIACGDNCTESYDAGRSVTLMAIPAAGHRLSAWTGDCPEGVCTMTAPRMATAVFVPEVVLTVNKAGNGEGRVTATVDGSAIGIDCGTDCSETLAAGTAVELRAEAGADSAFVGWSGGCTGSDCMVTLVGATTVTAEFRRNQCTPNTTVCSNDATVVCNAQGQPTFTDCRDLGCWNSATGMPAATGDRCADLDPSNGLAQYLDMADSAPSVELADGTTINTDTGAILSAGQNVTVPTFRINQLGTTVEVRVFVVKDLILRGTTITGSPSVAFVADGPIQILGEVKASGAASAVPGATRDPSRCTAMAQATTSSHGYGSGGAGYGAKGGNGTGAQNGGAVFATELSPLVGGCHGPATSWPGSGYGDGGAGGGAIQLVSRSRVSVFTMGTSLGKLHVGGAGGGPGGTEDGGMSGYTYLGGGGGGSGGGVLLEAPEVVLAGAGAVIAANGGGGGSGCAAGQTATASATPAPGGNGTSTCGRGGNGAAGSSAAANGTGVGGFANDGGGGGGLGYLVVRNTAGQFAPQNEAVVSATLKQLTLRKRAHR